MSEQEKTIDWSLIDRHFKEYKLYADCINAWGSYNLATSTQNVFFLRPIKNYDEYLRDKEADMTQYPNFFEYIQSKTNQINKTKYDDIIKQYNSELKDIKREQNWTRAKELYNIAYKIIFGCEPKIERIITDDQ